MESEFTTIQFPKIRRATIGVLKAAKRKNMIHSLIEVEISNARENIRKLKHDKKRYISLTGFVIYCVSKAVDANKNMHAYRNRKNQLVLFNDVDVSTTIERKMDGNNEVVAMIIRKANFKSASEISKEIRREKNKDVKHTEIFHSINFFLALPSFVRQLIFNILDRSPKLMKKRVGTIMVTSANMIGSGAGWGVPIATHTLNVTIGGVVDRIVEKDNRIEKKQHLCLTFSFDHDIIDGAPAARFVRNLKKIIEKGEVESL